MDEAPPPKPKYKPVPPQRGRTPGVPNRVTRDVIDKLYRLGCDPITGMAMIALGKVPCPTCNGKKRVPRPKADKSTSVALIVCPGCYGTGLDVVTTDLRGRMFSELANYCYPKRKAIEHSGDALGIEALLKRLDGVAGSGE